MTSETRASTAWGVASRGLVRTLWMLACLAVMWGTLPVGAEAVGGVIRERRPAATRPPLSTQLADLERRATAMEREGRALAQLERRRVAPLVATLNELMAVDSSTARRIGMALVREGERDHLDPRLLLAVMLVEDPELDPAAKSSAGAVGLMQVMPFHAGRWACEGSDLTDPDDNICHGARILANALRRTRGDLDAALLLYNGCTPETGAPGCFSYPNKVYNRLSAGRLLTRWADRCAAPGLGARPVSCAE